MTDKVYNLSILIYNSMINEYEYLNYMSNWIRGGLFSSNWSICAVRVNVACTIITDKISTESYVAKFAAVLQ